jgi:hypothetical protein
MVEAIVAFHVALVGRAERECDLTISRRIDLLWVESLQIGDRFCEARLERILGLVNWLRRLLSSGRCARYLRLSTCAQADRP